MFWQCWTFFFISLLQIWQVYSKFRIFFTVNTFTRVRLSETTNSPVCQNIHMGVEEETVLYWLQHGHTSTTNRQGGGGWGVAGWYLNSWNKFFLKWHNQWLVLIRMMVIYNVYVISYNTLSPRCEDAGWRNDARIRRRGALVNKVSQRGEVQFISSLSRVAWQRLRRLHLHP